MSAPPRYASMLESSSAQQQASFHGIGEYELVSLREEVERLRRDNGRYKEEVFDLKAVAMMQQEEAKTEANQRLRSIESELTFKEKNFQDINRKYIAIKRDLALQKQEIKQLKDKANAAAALKVPSSSSSSGASSQTALGTVANKKTEELQQTIVRLQRQLAERATSTHLSTPSAAKSNNNNITGGDNSSSSSRSRLLDDQTLSQLVSRCYEVLVALLLRNQGQPQADAGPTPGDARAIYSTARKTEGTLFLAGGPVEAAEEIERAFVALQVSLSSPQADEVTLLNMLSVAASSVCLVHTCLYTPWHEPAHSSVSPDKAHTDVQHYPAEPPPPRGSQESSYTGLNSTPSLLVSLAADRHGSSATIHRRQRERRGRDWAAAEPLPLLLRFLTRLLGTIIAAMPRVAHSLQGDENDLTIRFDETSPGRQPPLKKRRTGGGGALLSSLILVGAPASVLLEAHALSGLGPARSSNSNSERAGMLLDAYQDLLSLVASLVKQLLVHMVYSSRHREQALPQPLQEEVDEVAVELLLLLLPGTGTGGCGEGLITNDFIASKLIRREAEQQAPFLLSLFSDVDIAAAARVPGQAAGSAALNSIHVQTRLLQYLEQLLSHKELFSCFCQCQIYDQSVARGGGDHGKRQNKHPPSEEGTSQQAVQRPAPRSFCAQLAQLAEQYSASAHWPSASSCDSDSDAGCRAIVAAKMGFALRALRLLRLLVQRHGAAGVLALLGVCGGSGATFDLMQHPTRDPSAVNDIIVVAVRCARQLDGDWGVGDECAAELLACCVQLLGGVCAAASLQGFNNITTSESSQLVNGLLYRWCYGFCHTRLTLLAEPLAAFYTEDARDGPPPPE